MSCYMSVFPTVTMPLTGLESMAIDIENVVDISAHNQKVRRGRYI